MPWITPAKPSPRHWGLRWYSFNVGDVHFVCMDNVDSFEEQKKGAKYHAGFSDIQLQWLRQDLAFVGKDKMIFLYYHIPERDHTSHRNHDAVFSLIAPYENTVTACGHTHFFQPYMETEYGTSEYTWVRPAVISGGRIAPGTASRTAIRS